MAAWQKWEIAGFVTIAVALHVSAAAVLMPEQIAMGADIPAPPAPVAAGSGKMSDLIEQWENPPEAVTEPELTEPEEIAEPQIEQPMPDAAPDRAPEVSQVPSAPQLSAAKPNLPETPEPQPEVVEPELPELQSFEPPEIKSELALDTSTRPDHKPARPKPQPKRQAAKPQPEPKRQAAPQQQAAKPQPATQGGGARGNSSARAAGGGSGGVSAQQRASLQRQWQSQLGACIVSASRRANTSRRGNLQVSVSIAPNGAMQGVGLDLSSGNTRDDRAVMRAIQRVGRCPAAPAAAGVTESILIQLPIKIR
ncbi:TonB C-terminal domain-containing protein [Paracoccus saliphilus]|uniref:Outer membrane transport energization protein TonB n=1 Tax=Paracoccus saliphilus TaxID=405559 RepID=A0AA45W3R7_9RHOB|nr:TonB C-terminal domain-containing protein [Paracoccus saliphilus]WCR02593.1 TonB C-terminal domain-containing protein [Paracoccus saliphilus]SIS77882.1 outer membrane transport energization protein TonB [Paracoccus saliphilus]